MPKIEDLTLSDNIGREYTFQVYLRSVVFGDIFENVAGVYAFTKRSANQHGGWHEVLYIGKTTSFLRRLTYHHEKWGDAHKKGLTHICVCQIDDKETRRSTEVMLTLKYDPPLNKQFG